MGINATYIQVPFLNLIQLIVERAGRFHIRVGGNTQETARLTDSLADHKMVEKQGIDPNNPVSPSATHIPAPRIGWTLSVERQSFKA